MQLRHRFIIVLSVVAIGLIVQGVLFAHLTAARAIPPGMLMAELDAFPSVLGDWGPPPPGMEIPKDEDGNPIIDERGNRKIDEQWKYADEHFQRVYIDYKTGQQVTLWMVYSRIGEDRNHHPEICFQTYGQYEDPRARQDIEVQGHESPVQQLRFGNDAGHQHVYYWHYTLPSPPVKSLSWLQENFQNLRTRRASLTLQVFAREMSESTPQRATDFVKLADAAIQGLLGEDAVRGCQRLPVTLIEGTPIAE